MRTNNESDSILATKIAAVGALIVGAVVVTSVTVLTQITTSF